MILEFRTERDRNGNAKYLAFDTVAEVYSVSCRTWISKDIPKIPAKTRTEILTTLEKNGYKKVDYV